MNCLLPFGSISIGILRKMGRFWPRQFLHMFRRSIWPAVSAWLSYGHSMHSIMPAISTLAQCPVALLTRRRYSPLLGMLPERLGALAFMPRPIPARCHQFSTGSISGILSSTPLLARPRLQFPLPIMGRFFPCLSVSLTQLQTLPLAQLPTSIRPRFFTVRTCLDLTMVTVLLLVALQRLC